MKPFIILLLCLSYFTVSAQKKSDLQYGLWHRGSHGINEFSDIYKRKTPTSDHYRMGFTIGFHLTKVFSEKLYATSALGYSYYNQHTLDNIKYDEQSYPLEISANYQLFHIKNEFHFDVYAMGGIQRFIQYQSPVGQNSSTKHTSLKAGYGIGLGFYNTWWPKIRRQKLYKCFLTYTVYGDQKFYSVVLFTYFKRS